MSALLSVPEFIVEARSSNVLLLDSRSPGEFSHAHIPGAINLPLLNDEQRAQVGITFKKLGKEAAILKGFDLVGPHFSTLIREAKDAAGNRPVFLYCWRGGLRSNIMSWLLSTSGQPVTLLKGGYKSYRKWVLEQINKERSYLILGGRTGSGKTELLHTMSRHAAVLDLEALACHKGSAFGHLGQLPQPGNEQFENRVAESLAALPHGLPVWLENESTNIGSVKIPDALYKAIRESFVVEIVLDQEYRRKRILDEYGGFSPEELTAAMHRIRKRLGETRLKEATELLQTQQMNPWCDLLLAYYDKMYNYGMENRNPDTVLTVDVNRLDAESAAMKILAEVKAHFNKQPV